MQIGTLSLEGVRGAPIASLSEDEARSRGEERVQLVEDREYDYRLAGSTVPLSLHNNETIERSGVASAQVEFGRLRPGSRTGLLRLSVKSPNAWQIADVTLEVVSSKLSYRNDYRAMLERIASVSSDLLLDLREPVAGRFLADSIATLPSLQQRFEILRAVVGAQAFRDAVALITSRPHFVLESFEDDVDIRRGFLPNRRELTEMASEPNRLKLPPQHPLYQSMIQRGIPRPTVPATVRTSRRRLTLDTVENRFVKFVLETYLAVFADLSARFRADASLSGRRLWGESRDLEAWLESTLENPMFGEVGVMAFVPTASSVLQGRAGYREFLSTWIRFNSALALVWDGLADIVGGAKKRMGKLYEIWCFLELIALVRTKLGYTWRSADLFEVKPDGFGLRLRSGESLTLFGETRDAPTLTIRFDYNRTYGSRPDPQTIGSWSLPAKPDFSLSLWPKELSEQEAHRLSRICRLHFDAKYRANSLADLFGLEDHRDDEGNDQNRAGDVAGAYKQADIWKMHFYRDAIRQSQAALVLYPGDEARVWTWGTQELPAIGAMPFRPNGSSEPNGAGEILTWLKAAVARSTVRMA